MHQNQPWPLPGRYTGHGSRNSHEIQTTALAGHRPRQHLAGIAEEKRIQNECTLEKVAEQWLKEKKRTSDLSEDHAKDVWRSLEMHVFPSLGSTPVTEIRPKMLKEHLTPLEEHSILETLRGVISRLNEIFRFAISVMPG